MGAERLRESSVRVVTGVLRNEEMVMAARAMVGGFVTIDWRMP